MYLPPTPPRQYVSGETHRYLGRQYRLKIIPGDPEWVKLDRGFIYVRLLETENRARIKELVEAWYTHQARRVFHERLRAMLPRFQHLNLPEYALKIRPLEARWGSCTASGTITLNLKLMQVGKPYIDYVIAHELCHLWEHNHSKRFYLLLGQVMPDWQARRKALNESDIG